MVLAHRRCSMKAECIHERLHFCPRHRPEQRAGAHQQTLPEQGWSVSKQGLSAYCVRGHRDELVCRSWAVLLSQGLSCDVTSYVHAHLSRRVLSDLSEISLRSIFRGLKVLLYFAGIYGAPCVL